MNILQISGVAAFIFLSFAFYLCRRMSLFNIVSGAVIAGFVFCLIRFHQDFSQEALVLLFGLVLYWFGLLILRVILQRSVSLHLLLSYFQDRPAETIREEVSGRFKDALFFRLVRQDGPAFRLTLFGRFIATIVALFYFIVRIEK
jgi:hypothetical protein